MLPYFLIGLLVLSLCIVDRSYRFSTFYILIAVTSLFCGLRDETGNDYFSYNEIYQWGNTNDSSYDSIEPLFRYLINVFNYLNFNFEFFLFIFTSLIVAISYGVYRNIFYQNNFLLPIGLFFLNNMPLFFMSVIRQGMAAVLLFCAIISISNRRIVYFILLSISAALFHKVSIIISVLIYISYQVSKIDIRYYSKLLITLFTFSLILSNINIDYFTNIFDKKYLVYINNVNDNNYNFFMGGYFLFKIFIILVYLKYFYGIKKIADINIILLSFSVLLNILLYRYGEINLRISGYFDMSLVYVSAFLIFTIKRYKAIFTLIVISYFIIHYLKFIYNFSDVFIPYRNILI